MDKQTRRAGRLRTSLFLLLFASAVIAGATEPLKIGIIGLDNSHAIRFTELLNDKTRPDHVPVPSWWRPSKAAA